MQTKQNKRGSIKSIIKPSKKSVLTRMPRIQNSSMNRDLQQSIDFGDPTDTEERKQTSLLAYDFVKKRRLNNRYLLKNVKFQTMINNHVYSHPNSNLRFFHNPTYKAIMKLESPRFENFSPDAPKFMNTKNIDKSRNKRQMSDDTDSKDHHKSSSIEAVKRYRKIIDSRMQYQASNWDVI